MTGAELKILRKGLGLTQSELAEWLRLGSRDSTRDAGQSVRLWETGKRAVSGPVAVAMRAFAEGWVPPHIRERPPPG